MADLNPIVKTGTIAFIMDKTGKRGRYRSVKTMNNEWYNCFDAKVQVEIGKMYQLTVQPVVWNGETRYNLIAAQATDKALPMDPNDGMVPNESFTMTSEALVAALRYAANCIESDLAKSNIDSVSVPKS